MNLLAKAYYHLAKTSRANAQKTIKAIVAEAVLTNQPISDSFWFDLAKLDTDLLASIIPDTCIPSDQVWKFAIYEHPELLKLLAKRFYRSFKLGDVYDGVLYRLSPVMDDVKLTRDNLGNGPTQLSIQQLIWLATTHRDLFLDYSHHARHKVTASKELLAMVPVATLRSWLRESRTQRLSASYTDNQTEALLQAVIPELPAPLYQHEELLNSLENPNEDYGCGFHQLLCASYAKLRPAEYVEWLERKILGFTEEVNGKKQVYLGRSPDQMQRHIDTLSHTPTTFDLISPALETALFSSRRSREQLNSGKYPWKTIQKLKSEDSELDHKIPSLISAFLQQGGYEEPMKGLVAKLQNYEPGILKLGSISGPFFCKVLEKCTPAGKQQMLQSGLQADESHLTQIILKQHDVSGLIGQWVPPESTFWISELSSIHPANLAPLFKLARFGVHNRAGEGEPYKPALPDLYKQVLSDMPAPTMEELVQGIVDGCYAFKFRHIPLADHKVLVKLAQLVNNENALKTLRKKK